MTKCMNNKNTYLWSYIILFFAEAFMCLTSPAWFSLLNFCFFSCRFPSHLTPWGISDWWTKIHPSHCCHYIYSKMSGTVAVQGLETISGWLESRTFCPCWKQSLAASSSACPCQGLQPLFLCCDYFSIDVFHRC